MSVLRIRMMNLIKSGVKGLDNILKGGFKENSNILVTGAPGTGKTILCLQYANEGVKNKEPVLFVATEEFKEAIFEYAKTMGAFRSTMWLSKGWDVSRLSPDHVIGHHWTLCGPRH